MPQIAAVIFDMYETLARNTPALWVKTFDDVCRDQGLPLTGQELWDRWRPLEMTFRKSRYEPSYPFKSYELAWRECFERVFAQLGKGDAAGAARRSVVDMGRRELFPESLDVMARLKRANHLRLGLLSNADNDYLWPLLKRHSLEFDGVVSSEGARAYKPNPTPFQMIIEALATPASACLYVGDSQYDDIQGAHAVGMKTAWVNRRGAASNPALPAPDYQVGDLRELLGILGVDK